MALCSQLGLDPVFNIPFDNIADLLQIVQDMDQADGVLVLLGAQGLAQDLGQVIHGGLKEHIHHPLPMSDALQKVGFPLGDGSLRVPNHAERAG